MHYINNNLNTFTRYDLAKLLNFNVDNFDIFTSYILENFKKLQYSGTVNVGNNEYRPELVSYDLYGDTQYWQLLLLYNSIFSVNDFTADLTIKYPSLQSIESLYTNITVLQKVNQ